MIDIDMAEQIVKSLRDAENNDQTELAASLRARLAEINERIRAAGFAPIEA